MPREATQSKTVTIQGVEIPKLGFGTWQMSGEACVAAVRDALELGYDHLDCAPRLRHAVGCTALRDRRVGARRAQDRPLLGAGLGLTAAPGRG